MTPENLTCGTCKFQIDNRCRLAPPAALIQMMPKQSQGGLILGQDSPNGNAVEVAPMLTSTYPPAPNHMPACFQYAPRTPDEPKDDLGTSGNGQDK